MTQFETLSHWVDDAVADLPYNLSVKQQSRLQKELVAIHDYHMAEALIAASEIAFALKESKDYFQLFSCEGYCTSYVCWILGISDFNPFDYPELNSEDYFINTMKTLRFISFAVPSKKEVRETMTRLYGDKFKDTGCSFEVSDEASNDGYGFSIQAFTRPASGLIYRVEDAIKENADPEFSSLSIPKVDEDAFEIINSHDWLGVFTNRAANLTKLMVILKAFPVHNLNEFCEAKAMATCSLLDIDRYIRNRQSQLNAYTGVKEVDEILSHTWGVLLYSRQLKAIRELMPSLTPEENSMVATIVKGECQRNKCAVFTEVVDYYRLAYMKAHYPELFYQRLVADSEIYSV